jgi:hypothetical protein
MSPKLLETVLEELGLLSPRTFRIGGGRTEADGSVSFLIRFIGRDQGLAGELYLRWEDDEQPFMQPGQLAQPGENGEASPEQLEQLAQLGETEGEVPLGQTEQPGLLTQPGQLAQPGETGEAPPGQLAQPGENGEAPPEQLGQPGQLEETGRGQLVWHVDDLILGERQGLFEGANPWGSDIAPYERFF